jgi:integrase
MKGNVRQRGKHSWQIQVYTGHGRRHFETIRGNKGDAQRRLRELLTLVDQAIYAPPVKITVANLFNEWLLGYVKTKCSVRTEESYRSTVEHHLSPNLGRMQLKDLQPPIIQAYYSRACEKLSSKSVLYHHRILKQCLKYAVRQGYLGRNPCDLVDAPKARQKPMRTLTPDEVKTLLYAASGNQFYPVIYTAISTGLRQAELLGLRWRDIDFASQSISVCQTLYKRCGISEFHEPKTGHSKRCVNMTAKLIDYLTEYKAERESLWLHQGRLLKPDALVFSDREGKPIDPGVLSHNFARILKQAGIENARFHDLRHTFASLMLLRGAKPKVISEALGHASVGFTMEVYAHIIAGMQSEAMALLDGVLPPGNNANLTAEN